MLNEEQRKRLASKSGDNNSSRPPKYECPLIRFDGNKGTFRKVSKDANNENVETEIKSPFGFVILKKRRNLSSFSTNQSYFTNEHNTNLERIMLFKVIAKTVTLEDIGCTSDLREKYQTLKTHEVVYVLFDDEVCKMEIKGGSLGGYYDYQKSLSEEELHSFEVTTVIGSEKAKSEGGFGYYKMTFTHKTLEADFDLIEQKIDEVVTACLESDNYTKQKIAEKSNRSGGAGNLNIEVGDGSQKKKADDEYENFGKKSVNSTENMGDINPDDITF